MYRTARPDRCHFIAAETLPWLSLIGERRIRVAGNALGMVMTTEAVKKQQQLTASRDAARFDFRPARFLSNPHFQTLIPWALKIPKYPLNPIRRELQLDDGDHLVMQDDCPESWQDGDPVLLLLHGLSGCHQSAYMVRIAGKATARGIRTFRLDHRGSGAGRGLARHTYHAGLTDDVRAVLAELEHVCAGSPISIASFSLSANLMLKLLGEDPEGVPGCLQRVVAVSPPIDLHACVTALGSSFMGRMYDRKFAKWLQQQVKDSPQWREDVPLAKHIRPVQRVIQFDELYTAPAAGYRDVNHYYTEASAGQYVPNIKTETLILIARDDPMVPFQTYENLPPLHSNVQIEATVHGGHLGFYGTGSTDPDAYWMDWRILEWLFPHVKPPRQ